MCSSRDDRAGDWFVAEESRWSSEQGSIIAKVCLDFWIQAACFSTLAASLLALHASCAAVTAAAFVAFAAVLAAALALPASVDTVVSVTWETWKL